MHYPVIEVLRGDEWLFATDTDGPWWQEVEAAVDRLFAAATQAKQEQAIAEDEATRQRRERLKQG